MAAARAADGHGGGGDHGGRSATLDNNRRRIVGILCSKLGLAEIGGVLIQVYLLLTFTSFVENPTRVRLTILYSLQLPGRQNLLETAEMTSACANQGGCYYYSLQKSTVSYEFLVPQPLSHQRYNSMYLDVSLFVRSVMM